AMHGRFLIFVWAWCLPLMLVVTAAEEQQVGGCSAKSCGSVSISAPFWFADWQTGRLCGSPGLPDFELTCYNGSHPLLPSSVPYSTGFAITNISYGERSLCVVDLGKLELFQDASDRCLPLWNTSVKLGRQLRIDPINLNLIFYNCTEEATAAAAARRDRWLVHATTMGCVNASNAFVRAGVPYDPAGDYAGYALEGCDAIILPVLGMSPGETSTGATDYEQLIKDG
uniref:Wall-associated receptor kinase galacturonan-binding domain-containing protein n=1 Tax=Aegilops tauschii subsp. strangulata TaxID=200361 RepID=A0A453DUV4_AEGTS